MLPAIRILDFAIVCENDRQRKLALCGYTLFAVPAETTLGGIILVVEEHPHAPALDRKRAEDLETRRRQHEMQHIAIDVPLSKVVGCGCYVIPVGGMLRRCQTSEESVIGLRQQLRVIMIGGNSSPLAHGSQHRDVPLERCVGALGLIACQCTNGNGHVVAPASFRFLGQIRYSGHQQLDMR